MGETRKNVIENVKPGDEPVVYTKEQLIEVCANTINERSESPSAIMLFVVDGDNIGTRVEGTFDMGALRAIASKAEEIVRQSAITALLGQSGQVISNF